MKEQTVMINKSLWLGVLLSTILQAQTTDSDFDGVPDNLDQCPNTSILNEVNAQGCTISILTLPHETQKEDMTLAIGYGYITNEDLMNREIQDNLSLQVNYYKNNWNYALNTGYYTHQSHDGLLDTTLSAKKRIFLNDKWVLGILGGAKLPTHEYEGNKVDYLLDSTLHYYPSANLSLFAGYEYRLIGDDDERIETHSSDEEEYTIVKVQNQHLMHMGVGYFISRDFYASLVLSEQKSKFVNEHKLVMLSSTLYYKINQKFFSTLYYKREIFDDDLHDSLRFKIGYHIW